ncbi:thiamine pyrophosphate-binding protein [Candidatus Entotheonella palauensis]|uniref:thiamine pyrophosphate-binding protein n=1 Tax=Candidatus Entotheonella palauensis TaxID=93172 RepID=UPI0021198F2A|nr:thiamine pyrophosphate-binding protein [Candidatus Entotheonella palauensis]
MAERRPQFGSDVIVDLLHASGIEYAACNPGATFRGLHDSIVNYGNNQMPELIECCHEEISVAIAHGYAKATGKTMAALIHNIVGLQHASMAIFNAWCDRAPVLTLGATGPMDTDLRRPWIDWIHTALVQGNLVRDYVKWDDQPHTVANVPESFLRALRIAQTDPQGPVYVCYDAGLQEEVLAAPTALPDLHRYAPPASPQAHPEALERAAELLANAAYPVIIADLMGRHPEAVATLVQLAECLACPVIDRGAGSIFPIPIPCISPMQLTRFSLKPMSCWPSMSSTSLAPWAAWTKPPVSFGQLSRPKRRSFISPWAICSCGAGPRITSGSPPWICPSPPTQRLPCPRC